MPGARHNLEAAEDGVVLLTVAKELERELGRKARPFSLDFVLLPVRDEQVRPATAPAGPMVYQEATCGTSWPDVTRHAWPARIFTMR